MVMLIARRTSQLGETVHACVIFKWGSIALQADTNTASVQNFVYIPLIVSIQAV